MYVDYADVGCAAGLRPIASDASAAAPAIAPAIKKASV